MSNMNSSPRGERYQQVVVDGELFYHDVSEDVYIPAPSQPPQISYDQYSESEESYVDARLEMPTKDKDKKRKYSLTSKLWMGGLAVGAIVLPPATHVAAELVANNAFHMFDPKPLTQEQLLEDINVSISKMVGVKNG